MRAETSGRLAAPGVAAAPGPSRAGEGSPRRAGGVVTPVRVRAVLGALEGVVVAGEAGDGPAAVALAAELRPDLVVTEAGLPGLPWPELAAALRAARQALKVIVLTGRDRGPADGADGYVPKSADFGELARAVLAAAGGGGYGSPPARGPELSDREALCVRLIALGYSNKQIAVRLELSVKTVETYKARSMGKLGLRSRVDLVRYAADLGWLAPGAGDPAGVDPRAL